MRLKGAEIVVRCLQEEGVEVVFGYPGGVVLDLYDEIYRARFRHVLVRHEQGGLHMADGYARATGKPGVVLVTSGPGLTNAVTGIATAYMDSIPMVVISGQVATHLIGYLPGQRIPHVVHCQDDALDRQAGIEGLLYALDAPNEATQSFHCIVFALNRDQDRARGH